MSEAYFRYYEGREYTDSSTYLTIIQENKKSSLFSFDHKKWRDFMVKVRKVHDQLKDAGVKASFLGKQDTQEYVDRFFAMNFRDKTVSMTGFKVDEEIIGMGDRRCKVYSLVDVDCANLPSVIRPYTNMEVNNTSMPVDLLSVVDNIPGVQSVVYNQSSSCPTKRKSWQYWTRRKTAMPRCPTQAI